MKVSIALDDVNKFETELPENKAKELFNDFVFSAMSNSNKQVQEIELSEPCYADEEEDDNFNTVEYFARREVGYKGNPRRMKSYPILKGFVYLECAKCGRRHGFFIYKEMESEAFTSLSTLHAPHSTLNTSYFVPIRILARSELASRMTVLLSPFRLDFNASSASVNS